MQQLAWLLGWKHLDGLRRMAGAAELMLLCSLGRCLKTCVGLCTSKPGSEWLGLHKLTPLPLLWGCCGSHPQPETQECRSWGLVAGKIMEFLCAASGSTCSCCASCLHSLARLWGLWDGLFGWKMELLPCGEGVGNVVLIRSCLVLAAQQQVELGLAAPKLGLEAARDVHSAGTSCEIAACGKLTFLSCSQLLFPEFLQHIVAFLIQLIPHGSGLCCSSAQAVVGQSQPDPKVDPMALLQALHGAIRNPVCLLWLPQLPTYPRVHSKGEEMAQLAGGSGCHRFASGRICPKSAVVLFSPHASGFHGCHGCGSCSQCSHFKRRQFLLLSSHRQG